MLRFRQSTEEVETNSYTGDGALRWLGSPTAVLDRKSDHSLSTEIGQWWDRSRRPVSSSVPWGSQRRRRGGCGGQNQWVEVNFQATGASYFLSAITVAPSMEMADGWRGSTYRSKAKKMVLLDREYGASLRICHASSTQAFNGYELL